MSKRKAKDRKAGRHPVQCMEKQKRDEPAGGKTPCTEMQHSEPGANASDGRGVEGRGGRSAVMMEEGREQSWTWSKQGTFTFP